MAIETIERDCQVERKLRQRLQRFNTEARRPFAWWYCAPSRPHRARDFWQTVSRNFG